jgi:hypothetical protein
MRLFLSLAQLESLPLNLDHEINLPWSKPSLRLLVMVMRASLDTTVFLPLPLMLLEQLDLSLLPVDHLAAYLQFFLQHCHLIRILLVQGKV